MSEPQTDIIERLRGQYPAGGIIPRPAIMEEAAREIERLREICDRYRWRPIAKMHEDYGPCVLINLDDPGYLETGNNLDTNYDEGQWSHFVPVPALSSEEAERLREAQAVAIGEGSRDA